MNDDQFFLANAYFDGELDAAERAIAEADPEVMAAVEQLRALQARVRDVQAPTSEARESAIDSALRTFDSQRSLAIDPGARLPDRIVPLRPRPAYGRWLGAAAAVVAIGFVGVVISRAGGSDDESAAPDAALSDDPAADARAGSDALLEGITAEAASGEATAEASAEETAAAAIEAPAAATPVTVAPSAAADATGDSDITATTVATAYSADTVIADPAGLAAAGAFYLDLEARSSLPPTPETSCDVSKSGVTFRVLAIANYAGADGVGPVLIAVDDTTAETLAVDPDTCSVIASSTDG